MRDWRTSLMTITLLLFLIQGTAFGFWLWSPKTSKFTSPRKMSKPVPKDQFQWALSFYEAKEYPRALQEMKNLMNRFPKSAEAAEALYTIGLCHEALENYENAFKAYEGVIGKYPNSGRIQEIIEREYHIANLFYSGKKRRVPGVGLELLPSYGIAIDIFKRVVENAPYGPYADLSQYKIGECHKKRGEYREAREAFEKLMEDYPKSQLVSDAKYQIALVSFKMSRGASYDEQATDQAISEFSLFIEEHPESELVQESKEAIQELQGRKAEKSFEIAEFYAKQKSFAAAKTYYNEVIERYAETSWARLALEKLTVLEKEEKKK
ncbi:MAG: outer membrane protein assembly factor BamD [Candidatus Omnitrophica bacterium]|nr:outer membrane protein assembly factor BamD [Candidatus Omnitrophota bacterium]